MTKSSQLLMPEMYGQSIDARLTEVEKPPGVERLIHIDTEHPIDETFAEYGHHFYKVYVKNGRGKWTPESGLKFWEQDGSYRKILPFNTPVYPFEQMDNDIQAVIDQVLKDSKFEIVRRDTSHNGYAGYWTLLSDLRKTVKGSFRKDDVVQLGLVLRNGIGTGVALGADYYTYTLLCENGAVGRGQNFGSLSIRHVGDQKRMIETFKNGIPMVVKLGEKVVDYYIRATQVKNTNEMVQHIFKKTRIGARYFPEYVEIDTEQKKLEKKVTLTREGRTITLYELFNDLTEGLTKTLNAKGIKEVNGKKKKTIHLGFSIFSNRTRALHKSLMDILDNRVTKSEAA